MSDSPIPEEQLEAIAESALLSGALAEADALRDAELAGDPEWAQPRWTHQHTIVEAFAHGVIAADCYFMPYTLPPHFESVVNWIAFNVHARWGSEEVVEVSLNDLKAWFAEVADQHPEYRRWNETDKLIAVVSRYTPTPTERDFIDLDALVHNAALYLRGERRLNDDFERRFAAENPDSEIAWKMCPKCNTYEREGHICRPVVAP